MIFWGGTTMWSQSRTYTLMAGLLMGGVGLPETALAQFRIDIDGGPRHGYGGYGDAADVADRLSERLRDVHVDLHYRGLIERFQPQMNYARETIDELERRLEKGDASPHQVVSLLGSFDAIWHPLREQLLASFGPYDTIGQRVAVVSDLDQRLHQVLNVPPVAVYDQGPAPGYYNGRPFDRHRHGEPVPGYRGYRGYEPPYRSDPYNGSYRRQRGYGQPYRERREPSYGGPAFGGGRSTSGLAESAAQAADQLVQTLERELGPGARNGVLYDSRHFAEAVASLSRELRQTGSAQAAKDEAAVVSRAWERLEPQLTSLPPGRFPRTMELYSHFHDVLPDLYRALGREQAGYY